MQQERSTRAPARGQTRAPRVLMVVCSHYPQDPRVRREAEALLDAGMEVDVLALRAKGAARRERVGGVRVSRLPVDRRRAGRLRYVWDYARFITLALIAVSWRHLWRRYRLIHVHNMPDVLVATALLPRLTGARVILDLHDPTPEVYQTRFGIRPGSGGYRLLVALERLSIRFAHLALTPNIAFRRLFIERGCPPEKIRIIMNSPQESVFGVNGELPPPAGRDGPFTLMFHGGIYDRHGLELALRAIDMLRERIPNLRFEVFGAGDGEANFHREVTRLKLHDRVFYRGQTTQERIASAIASIDLGLIPNRRTPFTELNFPTRIFEYLCLGRPVIVPRTRGIRDYFDDDEIFYFDPDRPESLAEAIARVHDDPAGARAVVQRGFEIYRRHAWARERAALVEHVRRLLDPAAPPAVPVEEVSHDRVASS